MQRKGQAAMEFLMTYGWAILAAVVAIGVLAYFGVFSPGRYVSEMCVLGAPFGCDDESIADSSVGSYGAIQLIIRNGGGDNYNITEISITNCVSGWNTDLPITIETGEVTGLGEINVSCDSTNPIGTGDQFKGTLELKYQNPTGGRIMTSSGNIVRTVI